MGDEARPWGLISRSSALRPVAALEVEDQESCVLRCRREATTSRVVLKALVQKLPYKPHRHPTSVLEPVPGLDFQPGVPMRACASPARGGVQPSVMAWVRPAAVALGFLPAALRTWVVAV